MPTNILSLALPHIPDTARVLDLGAGDGRWSKLLVEKKHASVIAVDRRVVEGRPHEQIHWITSTIHEWLPTLQLQESYDAMLLLNVIQFLDKDWTLSTLLPTLGLHLAHAGVMVIETFFAKPDPGFVLPLSLFASEEIIGVFPALTVLHASQAVETKKDLQGEVRTFSLTRVILKNGT